MDDTYLKTIFWVMVVLYTLAVIGVWENFIKPLWSLGIIILTPVLSYLTGLFSVSIR